MTRRGAVTTTADVAEVAQIEENADVSVVAEVEDVDYVKVKSPFGVVTTVPQGLVAALLESSYSKSK